MTGAELYAALVAAIDEDERLARRVPGEFGEWRVDGGFLLADGEHCTVEIAVGAIASGAIDATGAHIARHDPARVPRQVKAFRRILELHKPGQPQHDEQGNYIGMAERRCGEHRPTIDRAWCHDCKEWCYPHAPCERCPSQMPDELRALAGIYEIEVQS